MSQMAGASIYLSYADTRRANREALAGPMLRRTKEGILLHFYLLEE